MGITSQFYNEIGNTFHMKGLRGKKDKIHYCFSCSLLVSYETC